MQQSISGSDGNEDSGDPRWFIYVVENRLCQLYTGITTNPTRRIRQHNGEIKGGARALKGKGPVKLKLLLTAKDRRHAHQVEIWLKSLTRINKLALIDGRSPLPNNTTNITDTVVD